MISIHAISILYELRTVRALLSATVADLSSMLVVTDYDVRRIDKACAMTDLLIRKVENAEDIETLVQRAAEAATQAGLGEERLCSGDHPDGSG